MAKAGVNAAVKGQAAIDLDVAVDFSKVDASRAVTGKVRLWTAISRIAWNSLKGQPEILLEFSKPNIPLIESLKIVGPAP